MPPLQPSAAMPMLLARHTLARSLDTLCGCSLPTVILYTSGALLATIANSPSAHRDIFIRVFDYLEWTALRALLHAGEATRHLQKREKEELYAHQSAASQRYCQLFYCRGILSLSCSVFPPFFHFIKFAKYLLVMESKHDLQHRNMYWYILIEYRY